MGGGFSKMAEQELVATIRDRCRQSSKKDERRILDEFTAITGHHRKHGIRLLSGTADNQGKQAAGRRNYDEAVREAVIVVWEASDRICGKRLKAALPNLVDSMERHGHLSLDPLVREHLLSASAAILDQLLKPIRPTAGSRRRRKRRPYMGSQVPVRTYNDWNWPPPGFLEIDLVAHCGGTLSGSFTHSLVATNLSLDERTGVFGSKRLTYHVGYYSTAPVAHFTFAFYMSAAHAWFVRVTLAFLNR